MSDASTLHPMAGLAPPPEKMPSLLKQLNSGNAFETLPRVMFEQPIYRSKSSFGVTLMVHDPEGVRRVLLDNAANYPKEEMSNRFFTAMFGEGLLSAEPAMWRRHRKIMAPSFDPRSIASYAPAMAAASQAFAAHWDGLPDGADVDMAEEMKALTLRIICETMFSSDAPEVRKMRGLRKRERKRKDPPKRVLFALVSRLRGFATGFVQSSPCFRRDPCVAL